MSHRLDMDLDQVSLGENKLEIFDEVVRHARRYGYLNSLIAAAKLENPRNEALKRL